MCELTIGINGVVDNNVEARRCDLSAVIAIQSDFAFYDAFGGDGLICKLILNYIAVDRAVVI